jgi:ABC-type transporter Mla maintaining outer membrane lipid asymmetry permease subunit MlaE
VLGGVVGIAVLQRTGTCDDAVLIAGRIGSAMTAEIGSMQCIKKLMLCEQ